MAGAAVVARPAELGDVQVLGDVSGGVKIGALPDLGLEWRVAAGADGLVLSARRAGVDLGVELRPAGAGAWKWTIRRANLDLAELWPLLRPKLGAEASGWSASGRIELAGEGTWASETGPVGELRMALREGWARSDELEAEISGAELDLHTTDLAAAALSGGQSLRVAKVALGNLRVTDIEARFGLSANRTLDVQRIAAKALGGSFQLNPISIPLLAPSLDAVAEVHGVSVSELARLAPQAITEGTGTLSGRVGLAWSVAEGLEIRTGTLTVQKAARTSLRLAPQPGFLTGNLPFWLNVLSPKLVKDLRRIEQGTVPIAVDFLEVVFNPDGADGRRTAQIKVEGRPEARSSVRSVKLEVNMEGDLTRVLMLGLNDQVSVEF